jgi:site-specific recombinase XerD
MRKSDDFPYYLSRFLSQHLPMDVGASINTVMSYRDTFALFVKYCKACEHTLPENISLDMLSREMVERFLFWLESERRSGVATRNQRLAAIHSFCRFMQIEDVIRINQYQRILSIPKKKASAGTVNYLSLDGIKLVLAQPDAARRAGCRDLVLLSLMYDSGARVQEIADLTVGDIRTDAPAIIRLTGKGGKTRSVPLMEPTANLVAKYLSEAGLSDNGKKSCPLFANRSGSKLSRAGIKYILDKYVDAARLKNASVLPDKISPHSFRHSKAMHLLHAGVNLVYIRDILGHADLKTTEIYARIDGEMKRKALESAFVNVVPSDKLPVWQQDSELLDWLQRLGK